MAERRPARGPQLPPADQCTRSPQRRNCAARLAGESLLVAVGCAQATRVKTCGRVRPLELLLPCARCCHCELTFSKWPFECHSRRCNLLLCPKRRDALPRSARAARPACWRAAIARLGFRQFNKHPCRERLGEGEKISSHTRSRGQSAARASRERKRARERERESGPRCGQLPQRRDHGQQQLLSRSFVRSLAPLTSLASHTFGSHDDDDDDDLRHITR